MALQRVRGLGRSSSLARRGDAARRRGGARPRRGGRAAIGAAWQGCKRWATPPRLCNRGVVRLTLNCRTGAGLQAMRMRATRRLQSQNFICCDSAMLVGPRLGPARRESSGRPREGCTTMPGAGSFWVPVSNTLVVAFCRSTNDSLIPRPVGLQLLNKTLYTLPQPQRPSRRVYSSGQGDFVTKPPLALRAAVKARRSA